MDSPLALKIGTLELYFPFLFPPALKMPATGSEGESSKGSWEEVASNDTADGNLPMGRKRGSGSVLSAKTSYKQSATHEALAVNMLSRLEKIAFLSVF